MIVGLFIDANRELTFSGAGHIARDCKNARPGFMGGGMGGGDMGGGAGTVLTYRTDALAAST